MAFVSLQNISAYSLLQGPTTVADLVQDAVEKGYDSIALTDYNYTYGFLQFNELAQAAGIKPIFGVQLSVKGVVDQSANFNLIFIAKDQIGYQNLLKLSSYSALQKEPQPLDKVHKYLSHLFIITPANSTSELVYLDQANHQLIDTYMRDFLTLIPTSSSLYLGVYAADETRNYVATLRQLEKQYDVPLVALEDVLYRDDINQFERKVLVAIGVNDKIVDAPALAKMKGSHALLTPQDVAQRYHKFELDDAVRNTEMIAAACNVQLEPVKRRLPVFKQDKFATSSEYLLDLVERGLRFRFKNQPVPKEYRTRIQSELAVINSMGFADYFLIVWDVVRFAHHEHIMTGPGRGSAAGSLVSYALQITGVDPIKYGLIFERFLNPARAQMPDIDLDLPDKDRERILDYMFTKYGLDHVAQIITFGTFGMKQAVRDTGRVFGQSEFEMKRWSEALGQTGEQTLSAAFAKSKKLQTIVKSSPQNQLIFDTARLIEGIPRNSSTHAAGIVLTDGSLVETVGLQAGSTNSIPLTQQTMTFVEKIGLLKIDFLALSNLTLLDSIVQSVKQNGTNIVLEKIPLDDKETLALFARGDTEGIFQFDNTEDVKRMLRQIKPDSFLDIVAANALNRPGPSVNIPHFVARKHRQEQINYLDPTLETFLKETYGIILYQEQVMQVARVFAGFSLADADLLRRAISKKKFALLEEQKQKFIRGAVERGHAKKIAVTVFEYIERFGGYGFNKSHAVAYSMLAFWLAYFKVHFPGDFYASQLNLNQKNLVKSNLYMSSAQYQGIKLAGPNINTSGISYIYSAGVISMGLTSIKGVALNLVKDIIAKRQGTAGPFRDLTDFLQRIEPQFLRVEVIENIVKSGAFDELAPNRHQLLNSVSDAVQAIKLSGNNTSIFDILEPKLEDLPDFDLNEKSAMEEEVLGISFSQNLLIDAQKYAQKLNAVTFDKLEINQMQLIVGKLLKYHQILTKKNEQMAFLTFTDGINQLEVTAFPQIYRDVKAELSEQQVYLLRLKTQADRYDIHAQQHILNNLKKFNFSKKD